MTRPIFIRILTGLILLAAPRLLLAVPLLSATVTYEEVGGPQDQNGQQDVGDAFRITNTSDVGVTISNVQIVLGSGLVYDTAAGNDGTAPSFPFTSATSDPNLLNGGSVPDGSPALSLSFAGFDPLDGYDFSVDVDEVNGANDNQKRQVLGNRVHRHPFRNVYGGRTSESCNAHGTLFWQWANCDCECVRGS